MEGSEASQGLKGQQEDSNMSINFDDTLYVSGMPAMQPLNQIQPPPPQFGMETENSMKIGGDARDSYTPSFPLFDGPIPSGTYGKNGMMMGDFSSVQNTSIEDSMTPTALNMMVNDMQETVSEDMGVDFMNILSDTLRANMDSIQDAMDQLGITMENLNDQDSVSSLVHAMNLGASNLGVPQLTDIDQIIETIMNAKDSEQSGVSERITTYSFSEFGLPDLPSYEGSLQNRADDVEKIFEEKPKTV